MSPPKGKKPDTLTASPAQREVQIPRTNPEETLLPVAACLIYFGPDEWNRILVLRKAGYDIRECHDVPALETTFKTPPPRLPYY